jgi:hypothetical protein
MFRRVNRVALLANLLALVACTVGQPASQQGSAIAPPAPVAGFGTVITDKDCQGVRGVTVAPCPIVLTKDTKSGIVVTVSGPGVVDSVVEKLRTCSNDKVCYNLNRAGSGLTQWRLTSGRACGVADIRFFGLDSAHNKVGYAFLKATNKYCP